MWRVTITLGKLSSLWRNVPKSANKSFKITYSLQLVQPDPCMDIECQRHELQPRPQVVLSRVRRWPKARQTALTLRSSSSCRQASEITGSERKESTVWDDDSNRAPERVRVSEEQEETGNRSWHYLYTLRLP
jgi:hypothetical protein